MYELGDRLRKIRKIEIRQETDRPADKKEPKYRHRAETVAIKWKWGKYVNYMDLNKALRGTF